jgi:hypothetical protein
MLHCVGKEGKVYPLSPAAFLKPCSTAYSMDKQPSLENIYVITNNKG